MSAYVFNIPGLARLLLLVGIEVFVVGSLLTGIPDSSRVSAQANSYLGDTYLLRGAFKMVECFSAIWDKIKNRVSLPTLEFHD